MDWTNQIERVGEQYALGEQVVEERRRAWETAAATIHKVMTEAKAILETKKLSSRIWAGTIEWQRVIQLDLGTKLTGIAFQKQVDDGVEMNRIMEFGAGMGYCQSVGGWLIRWQRGHHTNDFPSTTRNAQQVETLDPRHLSEDHVRKHVADFLEMAISTSYRKAGAPDLKTIGFVPTPSWNPETE